MANDELAWRQGLKKGEKVVRLGVGRCVSNSREELSIITAMDCVREGFPEWMPDHFVDSFCRLNRCEPSQMVNRIEFEYVDYQS